MTAGELDANEFLGRDIPIRLFPEGLGIGGAADACVYSGKRPDTVMRPDRSVENDPAYQAELARRRTFIPGSGR